MAFVEAKCPNCGGVLQVNESNEAAICTYCGTPFITEKAINSYNIINNNTINTPVVNMYNSKDLTYEDYYEKAMSYCAINQYEKAKEMLIEARRLAPQNGEIEFIFGMLHGVGYISESYRSRFSEMPSWEKEWISKITEDYDLRVYISIFSDDETRCKYIIDTCGYLLTFPNGVDGLRYMFLFLQKSKGIWPSNSLMKLVLQTNAGKNWNPYEEKTYIGYTKNYKISSYDIIKNGWAKCFPEYSGVEDYLFEGLTNNKELLQYIDDNYSFMKMSKSIEKFKNIFK